MRIAHTCASCGYDLTRTPAPIDPIYGLPIVVCPGCTAAVVRREHPTMVWSWWIGRMLWVKFVLAVRVLGTIAIAAISIAMSALLTDMFHDLFRGRGGRPWEAMVVVAIIWLMVALIGGFWVGFWFVHWRRLPLGFAWLVFLLFCAVFPGIVSCLDWIMGHAGSSWTIRELWNRSVRDVPDAFVLLLLAWAISMTALLPGRAVGESMYQYRRRAAWRRRRARRKARWTSTLLLRA